MPTYQYACTACGQELEAVQTFTEPSLTECPACKGALRKVFSAVGVVFKGSGFYKTDSRSSSSATDKPAAAKSDTAASPAATTPKSDSPAKSDSSSSTPTKTSSSPAA